MGSARLGEAPRVWKTVLLGACLMLLAATVVTDLLWGMSFASVFYGTHRVSDGAQLLTMAATTSLNELGNKDGDESGGPALVWEEAAEAPVARLDGAAVQIAHLFYVFAGYATIDEVVPRLRALFMRMWMCTI